jgi:hypothetical protein
MQQKKELESNVIAYQPQQQPVFCSLFRSSSRTLSNSCPSTYQKGCTTSGLSLSSLKAIKKCTHYSYLRAGWIDINNLTAKVPLVGSSVYVKILKVKSNAHNKMFNLEKLARVGLGNSKPFESLKHVKGPQLGNAIPNKQKE